MKSLRLTGLGVALAVIVLDQLSKPLMRDLLAGGDIVVAPYVSLVSAWNEFRTNSHPTQISST